ncbi:hypothetical protein E1218_30230 [Kribbella turkmenica]|uniref:Uncharacterized protein n=1 Tax=Kribbella turkmenica TaxID=2530375 RepID=A0A4R4WPG3_9ACTN|nr:hypothetical protein [Kribbella turkmenica]TDD16170.1 hypothetical protein E1218_30230 [Kribbella turkmenica]
MVRRTLALFVALFAVAALGAAPARAGGPTSVLLSSPPAVVAVGYEDQRYADLQRLTEMTGARDAKENHAVGRFVRATWLIHDMSVWRVDIIYPDAPGGPWIATRASRDGSTLPESPIWHQATEPAGLLELLGSMQLLSKKSGWGGPTYLGPVPEAAAEEQVPEAAADEPVTEPPAATAQTTSDSAFTGWRWTIPGFLLGAVVAVIAVRLLPKRPDWQLVDAE